MLVLLSDIVSFIDNHLKPIESGEQLIKAGYFVKYGITQQSLNEVHITGLCLQSTNVREKPHELNILLKLNSTEKSILKALCTCKAGATGKCKHCVGLLIILSRLDDTSSLDQWSPTDKPCAWIKNNKNVVEDKIAPKRLTQFCHFPSAETTEHDSVDESVFEKLLLGFPNSSLCKHLSGRGTQYSASAIDYNAVVFSILTLFTSECCVLNETADIMSLSTCCQEVINFYYDFVDVSLEESKKIYALTVKQNNLIWNKQRQVRFTGSTSHALYTYAKNKNPDWTRKFDQFLFSTFAGNEATRYGKANELLALKIYAAGNEGEVITEAGFLVKSKFPWLGYSADGFHRLNKELILLEVKCPVKGNSVDCRNELIQNLKYCKEANSELQLKTRHPYYTQIQLGLLLCNLKLAKLIILWRKTKSVIVVNVPFDEDFVLQLVPILRQVYFERFLPYLFENCDTLLIRKFGKFND